MIIVSVDVGDVRTGLAVCDPGEVLASPVGVIEARREEDRLMQVCRQVRALGAQTVVVGLPRNMDGSEGERARLCRDFAQKLSKELGSIPVELCDERSTTVLAHTYLSINDVRGRKRKKTVDAVAATIILEDFLALRKNAAARKEKLYGKNDF